MASAPAVRWRVPLADVRVSEEDIAAVAETYRSGWLSQGPRTSEFERAMEAYTGAPHAIAVTNCTAALHLMARVAGLGPGDEAIVPSLTFVATANAIAYTGATPVFADVVGLTEPWLDPDDVARRITPRTKAICCMQYGGHPGETRSAARAGRSARPPAARGRRARARHAHRRRARRHARARRRLQLLLEQESRGRRGRHGRVPRRRDGSEPATAAIARHDHALLAAASGPRDRATTSSRSAATTASTRRARALGISRLARLDDENAQRAEIDAALPRAARGRARRRSRRSSPPSGATLAHHLFTVVLDGGIDRDAVRGRLSAAGVQSSIHYPPAHRFEIYRAGARAYSR